MLLHQIVDIKFKSELLDWHPIASTARVATLCAGSMVSEGEALINSLREEMEKNSQLREQLSAREQV